MVVLTLFGHKPHFSTVSNIFWSSIKPKLFLLWCSGLFRSSTFAHVVLLSSAFFGFVYSPKLLKTHLDIWKSFKTLSTHLKTPPSSISPNPSQPPIPSRPLPKLQPPLPPTTTDMAENSSRYCKPGTFILAIQASDGWLREFLPGEDLPEWNPVDGSPLWIVLHIDWLCWCFNFPCSACAGRDACCVGSWPVVSDLRL